MFLSVVSTPTLSVLESNKGESIDRPVERCNFSFHYLVSSVHRACTLYILPIDKHIVIKGSSWIPAKGYGIAIVAEALNST